VRLQSLAVVLGWLDPDEAGKPWLGRSLARLRAVAKPVRDKRARLRGADELLALGHRLMESAEAGGENLWQRARRYRDGLMIATLACRPLRLKNLIALEIGRQLQRRDGGWWIEIDGQETKTGEPVSVPFPDALVPALEVYLERWRPQLASPGRLASSRALWLTDRGRGIGPNHAYIRILRHTRDAFGRSVNPHLFRDAAATTVAITTPDQVGIVSQLLGHRGIGTAQKHYNQARDTQAATAWHKVLDSLSKEKA
jgi:integrase/recombinase XerD